MQFDQSSFADLRRLDRTYPCKLGRRIVQAHPCGQSAHCGRTCTNSTRLERRWVECSERRRRATASQSLTPKSDLYLATVASWGHTSGSRSNTSRSGIRVACSKNETDWQIQDRQSARKACCRTDRIGTLLSGSDCRPPAPCWI